MADQNRTHSSQAAQTPQSTPTSQAPKTEGPDVESLSYEQARDELVSVVTRLESGGAPLEESIALWERGEALAQRCESLLDGVQKRLDAARESKESGSGEE